MTGIYRTVWILHLRVLPSAQQRGRILRLHAIRAACHALFAETVWKFP